LSNRLRGCRRLLAISRSKRAACADTGRGRHPSAVAILARAMILIAGVKGRTADIELLLISLLDRNFSSR
jgi:hypothetical protein